MFIFVVYFVMTQSGNFLINPFVMTGTPIKKSIFKVLK